MDGAHVNGKQVVGKQSAIIDTGTTLIIGDKKSVDEAYKAVSGAEYNGDGTYTS